MQLFDRAYQRFRSADEEYIDAFEGGEGIGDGGLALAYISS